MENCESLEMYLASAGIAEDARMTLAEHDHIYHHDNYQGGECSYREVMKIENAPDDMYLEANRMEGIALEAKRREREAIIKTFTNTANGLGYKKSTVKVGDQNKNNLTQVKITLNPNDKAKPLGLDVIKRAIANNMPDYKIPYYKDGERAGKPMYVERTTEDGKREIAFLMHKEGRVGKVHKDNAPFFVHNIVGDEPMSYEKRNAVMSRFGMIFDPVTGEHRKMTAQESRDAHFKPAMRFIKG